MHKTEGIVTDGSTEGIEPIRPICLVRPGPGLDKIRSHLICTPQLCVSSTQHLQSTTKRRRLAEEEYHLISVQQRVTYTPIDQYINSEGVR
jgi:hypothetical protein